MPLHSLLLFLLLPLLSSYELFQKTPTLSGLVDDCCCEVQTVEKYNDEYFSVLEKLVETKFFRLFQVNYLSECPFLVETFICQMTDESHEGGPCGICECEQNEIPLPWKEEDKQISRFGKIVDNPQPPTVDSDSEEMWISPDYSGGQLSYVDLMKNPERYTGYGGFNATRIWAAIYNENCFSGEMCFEQRVFYRIISGMHASITAHIFENFYSGGKFQPNVNLFAQRLGAFPDRLKNIYFTFLFMLRAAEKVSDYLRNYSYNTGNPVEDKEVHQYIQKLFNSEFFEHCGGVFDETMMFKEAEKASLKKEFQRKFINISEIMDCVSCESCKVHAKLMILGLATGLKILLSSNPITHLQRNEVIAFVNTLFKLADSVRIVRTMRQRENEQVTNNRLIVFLSFCLVIIFLVVGSYIFGSPKKQMPRPNKSKSSHKNAVNNSTEKTQKKE